MHATFTVKEVLETPRPGTINLTVESATHDIELFEIRKTAPFDRNPALELVAVAPQGVIRPQLQSLEGQRKVLW